MNGFAFIILLAVTVIKCLSADEFDLHISSKNSKDITAFLIRMLSNNDVPLDHALNKDINDDIKVDVSIGGCQLCQLIITGVFSIIKDKTEAEVRFAMRQVCNNLPFPVRHECQSMVNQYLDRIVDLIINQIPKEKICQQIGLCSTESIEIKEHTNSFITLTPAKEIEKVTKVSCKLCQLTIKLVFKMIRNKTKAEVQNVVLKVCDYVPLLLRSECKSFIKRYADKIIKLIINDVERQKICKKLGLCKSCYYEDKVEDSEEPGMKRRSLKDMDQCRLCQQVVFVVDQLTFESRSKALINAALDKVCNYIPMTYYQQCLNFVATHRNEILNDFLNGMDYANICSSMGICDHVNVPDRISSSSLPCHLCIQQVHAYQDVASEVGFTMERKYDLLKICKNLPLFHRSMCKFLLNKNSDEIIKLIIVNVPQRNICRMLGLCMVESEPIGGRSKPLWLTDER